MSNVTTIKDITYTADGKVYDAVSTSYVQDFGSIPIVEITVAPTPRGSSVANASVGNYLKECRQLQKGLFKKDTKGTVTITTDQETVTYKDWILKAVNLPPITSKGVNAVKVTLIHPVFAAQQGRPAAISCYNYKKAGLNDPGADIVAALCKAFTYVIENVIVTNARANSVMPGVDQGMKQEVIEIDEANLKIVGAAVGVIKNNVTSKVAFPFKSEGDFKKFAGNSVVDAVVKLIEGGKLQAPLSVFVRILHSFGLSMNPSQSDNKMVVDVNNPYKKPTLTINTKKEAAAVGISQNVENLKGVIITAQSVVEEVGHCINYKDRATEPVTGGLAGFIHDSVDGPINSVTPPSWLHGFFTYGKNNTDEQEKVPTSTQELMGPTQKGHTAAMNTKATYLKKYCEDYFWRLYNKALSATVVTPLWRNKRKVDVGMVVKVKGEEDIVYTMMVSRVEHRIDINAKRADTTITGSHVRIPEGVVGLEEEKKSQVWS